MATAVMDEVLRQKDPDLKEAVARAREGEAGEAMTRLSNRVTEHRVEDLGAEAARAWLALWHPTSRDCLCRPRPDPCRPPGDQPGDPRGPGRKKGS